MVSKNRDAKSGRETNIRHRIASPRDRIESVGAALGRIGQYGIRTSTAEGVSIIESVFDGLQLYNAIVESGDRVWL